MYPIRFHPNGLNAGDQVCHAFISLAPIEFDTYMYFHWALMLPLYVLPFLKYMHF